MESERVIEAHVVTLQRDADGAWIWAWEMPDGTCVMGTSDTDDGALAESARTIREFYERQH